jgi:hypothetical protein
LGVRRDVGLHRIDDQHVIGGFAEFGEKIGYPQPALTPLLELPRGLHPFATGPWPGLSIGFFKFGFVIEGIHMRGAASHVEKDHSFCFGWEMSTGGFTGLAGEPLLCQQG